ncbi:unnamed protein product [Rotaria sp. Silwood1]|nr:unnamed protein product [Rotaria sp. Silwood1]
MLIIHRGDDYRVSNTQGISAFTTLKRRGIPSRMLYLFSYRKSWNTESTQFTYLPSRKVLQRYIYIDENRAVALSSSHDGYMVN